LPSITIPIWETQEYADCFISPTIWNPTAWQNFGKYLNGADWEKPPFGIYHAIWNTILGTALNPLNAHG